MRMTDITDASTNTFRLPTETRCTRTARTGGGSARERRARPRPRRPRGRLPLLPASRSATTARVVTDIEVEAVPVAVDARAPTPAASSSSSSACRCPRVPRGGRPREPAAAMHAPVRPHRPRGRGRDPATCTSRQYDAEVPFGAAARRRARCAPVARRRARCSRGPSRTSVASRPSRTHRCRGAAGFLRWADQALDADTAEAAIVLRRACDISFGRGANLDGVRGRQSSGSRAAGVLHVPGGNGCRLFRQVGTIRDFDGRVDDLLAEGPHAEGSQGHEPHHAP